MLPTRHYVRLAGGSSHRSIDFGKHLGPERHVERPDMFLDLARRAAPAERH